MKKTYYIVVINVENPDKGWEVQEKLMTPIQAMSFKVIGGLIYENYNVAKRKAANKNK